MWTLVVMSHGRWPYLQRSLASVGLGQFDRVVGAFDGCSPPNEIGRVFDATWESTVRGGLTANMARALSLLDDDDEWVFWLEEDFVIEDAPLEDMAAVLKVNRVANMVLARQPWNEAEMAAGSVLATIPGLRVCDVWCEHWAGFWLNPFVAHASLLRSLTPGVEQDLTAQCLDRGYSFGYWGGPSDRPRCWHIGAEGGMGSPGWLP